LKLLKLELLSLGIELLALGGKDIGGLSSS